MNSHLFHRGPRALALIAALAVTILMGDVQAQAGSGGRFVTLPDHFVRRVAGLGMVNWTAGFLSARASVALPQIVNSRNHPDFGRPGTVRSISAARSQAHQEAREAAAQKLLRLLGLLQLDAGHRVLDRARKDRAFRESLGSIRRLLVVQSRRTGEGRVSVQLVLPFRSESGLYGILAGSNYAIQRVPRADVRDIEDRISGIIVNVSQLPDFRPSLEMRIFTDRGLRIYGPEVIRRGCAIRRGVATYYLNRKRASQDPAIGLRPYNATAVGLLGRSRSDILISSADAARILGSRSGRAALRRCAVTIVVGPRKLRR